MDVKPTALPLPLGAVSINTIMSIGPGSFYEASKIIPILTEARDDSPTFHVVAPSLPNFGFSDGTCNQPGFGIKQYAETCHQIMQGLGYTQYASQGGDWVRYTI